MILNILLFEIFFCISTLLVYYLFYNLLKCYRKYYKKNNILIKDNIDNDYSYSDLEEFRQRSEDNLIF